MSNLKMHNPDSGDTVPVPATQAEVMRLAHRGFSMVEELIDTATGYSHLVCVEAQVQNGQGAERALSTKRLDHGHVGQRAFMRPDEWRRLSDDERNGYLKTPKAKDHTFDGAAALAAKVAEKDAEIEALRKQLAEKQPARAGGR